jgi:allophanate hydrolase
VVKHGSLVRAADRTPIDLASLRRLYGGRSATPLQVVQDVIAALEEGPEGIWIDRREPKELRAEARALEERYRDGQLPPLYGVPFGVKDSIDVAGVVTTVGCPAFRYIARETAPAVERLRAAGAIYVGKTNLDQFATGLVGVRSPYGIPPNAFDPARITGGSSSGSAAAVARGQVSFALATDTAGSGRVPAAFNNVVGLKPSRGLLSTRGLVPACRSVDCMTVIALTCDDARVVASVATGYDARDPFSRPAPDFRWSASALPDSLRVGVPRLEDRVFGDEAARAAFEQACADLAGMGWELEPVDMGPFFEAGRLLYGGPWIAERLSGLETFLHRQPESMLPVVRSILTDGERHRATEVFLAQHRLAELKRDLEPVWARVRALVVPTVPSHPTIEAVLADPIAQNAHLGKYTTFGNLLDLAGVAVPVRFRGDGLPFGITLLGPWGTDAQLLDMAARVHAKAGVTLGSTGWPLRARAEPTAQTPREDGVMIAVVGAHLSGQPLNHQLTDAGARFVRTTRTSNHYTLFALRGTTPPKPGLVRSGPGGAAIELEVWELPTSEVGAFLSKVGSPLAIGTIDIEDGSRVHGFLCEAHGTADAEDISSFGGWRAYLGHRQRND